MWPFPYNPVIHFVVYVTYALKRESRRHSVINSPHRCVTVARVLTPPLFPYCPCLEHLNRAGFYSACPLGL